MAGMQRRRTMLAGYTAALILALPSLPAAVLPLEPGVEGQPLAANAARLLQALDFLGHPWPPELQAQIQSAIQNQNPEALQAALDPQVLLVVEINPELRVKVNRGPGPSVLRQSGFTPVLVKVLNHATVARRLHIESPQAGPVYAGAARTILQRQQQTELNLNENTANEPDRFMEVAMFEASPMTARLSGLKVEYALALLYSSQAGPREATLGFHIGHGTQDLGFRGEVPVLFQVQPAVPVRLRIRDHDGQPTAARLTFRDAQGRIHPPQAKRLAPDFFFQPHIYRADGDWVMLSPGRYQLTFTRGSEYVEQTREIEVSEKGAAMIELELRRWIDPMEHGYYTGDHHIHGAGCSHYEIPTQGVTPEDMFLQVKGEGLNVGCVLTWGPCYDYQRRYFAPDAADISEPLTILKYDLEVSGFGSEALGHVCLLNLTNQTYPGSAGTKTKGWPTWTVPVMRWTKAQGGVTGYPHSDMFIDPEVYAVRFVKRHDLDGDSFLSRAEAESGLLPEKFETIDQDGDRLLGVPELTRSADRAGNELPNLVLPSMQGAGAMEIFVSAAEGVCDFTSAMNTGRVGEWNTWYHLMNCGLTIKLSGETDFPCMSSRRVGQGRVYVKLADRRRERIEFTEWCRGLAEGRSYVSDGFAHALEFTVQGVSPGERDVDLNEPGRVTVRARVAFAPIIPKAVAYGTRPPPEGRRHVGDTRILHGPRSDERVEGGERLVEIVRNGRVVAQANVPADGHLHELEFDVAVDRSSWIGLRQFPQLHTNPVNVLVNGRPIRASRESALWCAESVQLLWENRHPHIAESERSAARQAYDRAVAMYRERAQEAE